MGLFLATILVCAFSYYVGKYVGETNVMRDVELALEDMKKEDSK